MSTYNVRGSSVREIVRQRFGTNRRTYVFLPEGSEHNAREWRRGPAELDMCLKTEGARDRMNEKKWRRQSAGGRKMEHGGRQTIDCSAELRISIPTFNLASLERSISSPAASSANKTGICCGVTTGVRIHFVCVLQGYKFERSFHRGDSLRDA